MEHISVPAGVFSRKKQNRFPQRNESPSAKTKLFCRKALLAGAEKREKQGFGGLFPLRMESARAQTPVCPFASYSSCGTDARGRFRPHGAPWRRQNVAETGFRLSSCIRLGARGSRISVLFPPRSRLRGSRRGCFDVLTKCHLERVAVGRPFGGFATGGGRRHRNRPGDSRGPSFFSSRNH